MTIHWSYSDFIRTVSVDYSLWRFRWRHWPIIGRTFPPLSDQRNVHRLVRIRSPTLIDHVKVYYKKR